MSKAKKIAFVGVGRMGAAMAQHLKDEGYKVTAVYDVYKPAAEELAEEIGATAYTKLADLAANADIIFTVVTNDAAMKKIFTAKRDNLLGDAAGKLFINCATVAPDTHREITKLAKRKKADVLEACMASSIGHARSGELYLMIGGAEEVFKKNKRLFNVMSKDLTYVGPAGKAAEVKALVNMVMNINTAGLAEGLGLAKALKLDLDMVCKVFSQTGANSRVLETDGPDMLDRDHECWFSAEHAAKDSGIAQKLARGAKLKLPVNDATKAQYDSMVKEGLGDLDKSGVAEMTFPGRHANPIRRKRASAKKKTTAVKKKTAAKTKGATKRKTAAKKPSAK